MSAFIVTKAHIDAMLVRSDDYSRNNQDLDTTGLLLWLENYRSVLYRYGADQADNLPGPCDFSRKALLTYRYVRPTPAPTKVEALKLIACYEYQSCKHPDWSTSDAREICQRLRLHIIGTLPGYEKAPWEWD